MLRKMNIDDIRFDLSILMDFPIDCALTALHGHNFFFLHI